MTESLWDDTTEALTAEASVRAEQYARASVRPFLAYTGAAVTREDLDTRIALLEAPLRASVASATGSDESLPHALAEIRSDWLKTGTRYCPSHKVYVGEGNQEQHDHCNVETRKKKEARKVAADVCGYCQGLRWVGSRTGCTDPDHCDQTTDPCPECNADGSADADWDTFERVANEGKHRMTSGFRDMMEEKPSASGVCKWCGKDISKKGRTWESSDSAGADICTKNNSVSNPRGRLGDHQPGGKKTSTSSLISLARSLVTAEVDLEAERDRLWEIAIQRGDADALDRLADFDISPRVIQFYQEKFAKVAVNESANGSERYQRQPNLPPHLQDGFVDPNQTSVDSQVEEGKIENTPKQASDNSRVPGEKMPHEFERDSGEDSAPAQPRTTRPRVSPTPTTDKTYVTPKQSEADMDFSSPTFEQQVAAKVAKIAKQVVQDNPHLSKEQARGLALEAMSRHPGVVSTRRSER